MQGISPGPASGGMNTLHPPSAMPLLVHWKEAKGIASTHPWPGKGLVPYARPYTVPWMRVVTCKKSDNMSNVFDHLFSTKIRNINIKINVIVASWYQYCCVKISFIWLWKSRCNLYALQKINSIRNMKSVTHVNSRVTSTVTLITPNKYYKLYTFS